MSSLRHKPKRKSNPVVATTVVGVAPVLTPNPSPQGKGGGGAP